MQPIPLAPFPGQQLPAADFVGVFFFSYVSREQILNVAWHSPRTDTFEVAARAAAENALKHGADRMVVWWAP